MNCSYSKTELLDYTTQQTTVYISKNIHKKIVLGKETLRWTCFHLTKVEKFCFHDEIAIRITASKCPSYTLVRSLDLFIFMIKEACSQEYVLANRDLQSRLPDSCIIQQHRILLVFESKVKNDKCPWKGSCKASFDCKS